MPRGLTLNEKIVWIIGYAVKPYSELIEVVCYRTGRPVGTVKTTIHRSTCFEKTNDGYILNDEGRKLYKDIELLMGENAKMRYVEFLERPYIAKRLTTVLTGKTTVLELPFKEIQLYDADMADDLLYTPDNIISEIEHAVNDSIQGTRTIEMFNRISIVITDLPETLHPHEIRAEHTGKLIQVRGRIVLQQNDILPRIMIAAYTCQRCNQLTRIEQTTIGRLKEPFECGNEMCSRKGPFVMDQTQTEYVNGQIIYIEPPEGRSKLKVALTEHLCAPPWVRDSRDVVVTGILNQNMISTKNGRSTDTEPYLEAMSIKMTDDLDITITKKDIKLFQEWTKDEDELHRRIVASLAPYVHGLTDIKDSMMLSLFSDWTWSKNWSENHQIKSSIHGLIIGDPGLAKTELIRDLVETISPKGIYVSAESATAGGLSNAAVQEDGKWVIRSGLFARADGGLTGLDELDKLDPNDFKTLVSILQSQMQKAAKVGQVVPFNTRTAVWMGANPTSGNIDPNVPLFAQMGFKSWISSRVDVIWALPDPRNRERDEEISAAMIDYADGNMSAYPREIDIQTLRKYILYARTFPEQLISPTAKRLIMDTYNDIRKNPKYEEFKSKITPRTVASLTSMSKAVARRVCAKEVTLKHAAYAVNLYLKSLDSLVIKETDVWAPETVIIGSSHVSRRELVSVVHKAILDGHNTNRAILELHPEFTQKEISATISKLKQNGSIYENPGVKGVFHSI